LGFLPEGHLEIAGPAFDMNHFRISEEIDVGMIRCIDHFGCDDTSRAIESWESFIQLGHMAANRRVLLYKMDLESLLSDVQGSLHPGNACTDDQNLRNHIS